MSNDVEIINNNTDKFVKDFKEQAKKAMQESMFMIQADAQLNTPVRTGTLRRSITNEVIEDDDKITGVVGTAVEYAPFAELKKNFLQDAIDKNLPELQKKFEELKNMK